MSPEAATKRHRRKSPKGLAGPVAGAVLVALLLFIPTAFAAWTAPQLVSTGTTTGNYSPQIALDSGGNPNVVWWGYDGSAHQVYYAENTGSCWAPQLVSTGTTTGNVDPQIALDSGGNPNVV